jgi:hypothetical protein
MPHAEAQVETDRASRYLVQFCRHIDQMVRSRRHKPRSHGEGRHLPPKVERVQWSDTEGSVSFGWGHCTLRADADALTLRAEAADEENLRRLTGLLAHRLETIGRRDRLRVTWLDPQAPIEAQEAAGTASAHEGHIAGHRGRHGVALLILGALALTVHLGLLGAALASSPWMRWGSIIILALVAVKLLVGPAKVIGLPRRLIRRPRPAERDAGGTAQR